MISYLQATARQRIDGIIEHFQEWLPASPAWGSPHLPLLHAPVAFDDGVIIGYGYLSGKIVFAAAQDGNFMGGAIGEVHGAKLVGLLRKALQERPAAVILMAESGGVRLHEANAGLIAVSEVMRALLAVRTAGIPVIILNGGRHGCFGGMGIIANCADTLIMSAEARLGMSGPGVIETVHGVAEFDASDRALVWRVNGGLHRYRSGDCQMLVADTMAAFKVAAAQAMAFSPQTVADVNALEAEHAMLTQRLATFPASGSDTDVADTGRAEQPALEWQPLAAQLFPEGYDITEENAVLSGAAQMHGSTISIIGTTNHTEIGVETALKQAQLLLRTIRDFPGRPIFLLVDTTGQRLRQRDEKMGIQRYMAHLGKCIESARCRGHKILALVYGQALSGGFVSSGMMADACYALPSSIIRVMDLSAMARIIKIPEETLVLLAQSHPVFAPGPENYQRMGGIKDIWRQDLASCLFTAFADLSAEDVRMSLGVARGGRVMAQKVVDAVLFADIKH